MNSPIVSLLRRFAVLLLILIPAAVFATERAAVETLKPLLQLALTRGSAAGTLVGRYADAINATFQSTEPIEIDVRRVERMNTRCARFEIATRQRQVVDLDRKTRQPQPPADRAATYRIGWCTDAGLIEPYLGGAR